MSKIVTTELGRFRQVDDHEKKSFLFECPDCKEWLPFSEEHLNGSLAPTHFARVDDAVAVRRVCDFAKRAPYGAILVATMQARILMAEEGVKPYDTDYASLFLGE